jgi:hypothetical protein
MAVVEDGGVLVEESEADLQAFFKEPGRVHFVMMALRAGVMDCVQTLEHTHYEPRTPRNDFFVLRYLRWHDLDWLIVSIPEDEKKLMEGAAAANGLKIVSGVPTMIDSSDMSQFPVRGPNVLTVENVPGHPVYKTPLN